MLQLTRYTFKPKYSFPENTAVMKIIKSKYGMQKAAISANAMDMINEIFHLAIRTKRCYQKRNED